jgi:phosphonate transport system permease protein
MPVPPPEPPPGAGWRRFGWLAACAGLLAWSWVGCDIRPVDLVLGAPNSLRYAQGFSRPDFSDWWQHLKDLAVTLHMALWGTFLAVLAAVPLGLLASANLAPWWVRQPVRRLLDCCRAVHELVFALFFMVAVGLGPFAGMLALFVHTTGILGKLFSEVVEAMDPRPVEGIRATGANRLEEVVFGVVPQVLPLWISYSLYRFESNVRSASVVGMVGAGGIGMTLNELIRGFAYGQVAAVMLMLVATVMVIDLASAQVRRMTV